MKEELLYQNWVLSDEESTEQKLVFRPETYNFKPRRGGREALGLKPDKSFEQRKTGADDRYQRASGTWKLSKDDLLVFENTLFTGGNKLQIISVDKDKLVVKKL